MKSFRNSKSRYNKIDKGKHNRKVFLFTFIFVVIIGALVFLYFNFKISTVSLQTENISNKLLLSAYNSEITEEIIGINLFLFKEDVIKVPVGNGYIPFEVSSYNKKYPNYIEVYLNPPTSYFKILSDNGVFSISENGLVIQKDDSTSGNNLLLHNSLVVGDFLSKSTVVPIKFVLEKLDLENIKLIDVYDDSVVISYSNGSFAVLPLLEDSSIIVDKLMLLKKIARQYTIDSRGIDTIDLRYSKPVIKFN